MTTNDALLSVENLVVEYPVGRGRKVHAVSDVSFDVQAGETLGVVGESGCGKSTAGKAIVQLPRPTSGSVLFEGTDLVKLDGDQLRRFRPRLQMIFQDPVSSLNPRRRVEDIVGDPLSVWSAELESSVASKQERKAKVAEVLEAVGLDPVSAAGRRPHEFSGGQCQRISIARALVLEPKVLICDEPVSALDVSIQAQVINLLEELQDELHLSYIFVAHDLSVVRHVSDRIVVMYLGKLMEISPAEELYSKPIHPYTSALLGAIPIPDPKENRARTRMVVSGEPPNPINPPAGCRFHTRCPRASEICRAVEPQLTEYAAGHLAACHHPQHVTPAEIAAATRSDQSPASAGQDAPQADGATTGVDGPQLSVD